MLHLILIVLLNLWNYLFDSQVNRYILICFFIEGLSLICSSRVVPSFQRLSSRDNEEDTHIDVTSVTSTCSFGKSSAFSWKEASYTLVNIRRLVRFWAKMLACIYRTPSWFVNTYNTGSFCYFLVNFFLCRIDVDMAFDVGSTLE